MKDIKFLAIIVGIIVDVGGSLAFGFVFGIFLAIIYVAQGVPVNELSTVLDQKHLNQSIPLLLGNLGIGGFFSLTGGFVTGWIAKVSQTKNGLIMGVGSTLLSKPFWSFEPAWLNAAGCVFTIGAATAGGLLADAFATRKALPPPA